MTVQTNASTVFAISAGPPATNDAAGFGALIFTTVAEVVSIGEHGAAYALVTHNPLDSRRTKKFKGSVNDGTMTVGLGRDITDAGQILLIDGADGAAVDTVHSVKITYQDASVEFFQCKVMSYTRNPGTIDQIVGANTTLELEDQVIDA